MSMQESWGQGTTQTPSSSVQPPPIQVSGDGSFTPLACTPFDVLLSAPPLSASSNIGDLRRPSAKAPHPNEVLKCPRCESLDTKFCYYNNYSLTQPRYFCKNCKRYWTAGGALRNVPVGGGLRKNKRSKLKLAAAAAAVDAEGARTAQQVSEDCMQPLSEQSKFVAVSSQILDNRTASLPASGAMPSHALVPEIPRLYSLPSGEMCSMNRQTGELIAAASHCNAENASDQNGASATAPVLSSQAGNFYVKEEISTGITFFCDPNQVPQFYSNYTASMSMPFGTTTVPCSSLPGYSVNSFFTADSSRDTLNDKCDATTIDKLAGIGTAAMDTSTGEVKQEKDVAQGPVNTYDWQLISDGLFNGSDSSNFLYTPSSSWPDFTQFNDTGPG